MAQFTQRTDTHTHDFKKEAQQLAGTRVAAKNEPFHTVSGFVITSETDWLRNGSAERYVITFGQSGCVPSTVSP